jgi:hypothetical protein
MITLRFIVTLAILICLALPCAGCATDSCSFAPSSASAASVIPDGFGVNIEFTGVRPGEMKMLAEAGFRWVRTDLKWDVTEPAKGQYDFASYDRLMSELDQFSLHALLILDYTNPAYDNGEPPHTEEAREAFARWAVAAAKHFGGRGVIWETYNEPNIAQFWAPRPNVDDYVALALVVGRAFQAQAPSEKLVGPATSEIDFSFLETCFKAGLLVYWSAVSIHPYRHSYPETAAADYCRLREMIKTYAPGIGDQANAKREIPIISGEWGYSSVWSGLDDEKQGQLLARQWLTNAAHGVSVSIWYDWHDDGSDPKEPEHHFGLVYNPYHEGRESVFDPKPAYLAARTFTTFFSGYQFEKRLKTASDADYVLVFRKGSEHRVAAWTTASRPHLALIPLETGNYNGVSHIGKNLEPAAATSKGLSLNLTQAPVYLSER